MLSVVFTILAITLIPMYFIYEWVKLPPYLKDVPGISVTTVLKSLLTPNAFFLLLREKLSPVLEKNKLGKVFLGTMWVVFLADPEDCRKVCSQHAIFPKIRLMQNEDHFVAKFLGVNIANTNGDEWKKHRKLASLAFRRHWPVDLFTDCVYQLFDVIDQNIGQIQNAHDLMQRMTLDVLGKGLFEYDFKALKDRSGHRCKLYNNVMKGIFSPSIFFFSFIFKLPLPGVRKLMRSIEEFNGLLHSILDKKHQEYEEKLSNGTFDERIADLLTLMIHAAREDQTLTDEELRSDLLVYFIAGHDTTANSLTSILCYLALYPEYQEKARQEVLSVLGDDPEVPPTYEQQAKELPLINAIIKEAMRLVPPAPSLNTRECTEPVEFQGRYFPAGTKFEPHVYAMQRSKSIWGDPEVFRPERFMNDENITSYSWLPFGGGPRQCIGMGFSLMEQRIALSMLLRKYSWYLPKNTIHVNGCLKIRSAGLLAPEASEICFELHS